MSFHYEPIDAIYQAKLRIREMLRVKYSTPDATGIDASEEDDSEQLLQAVIAKLNNASKLFGACNVLVVHERDSARTYLRSMTAYIDYSNNMRSLQQLFDGLQRDLTALKPVIGYCDPQSIVLFDQTVQQVYTVSDELDDKITDEDGDVLIKRMPTTLKQEDISDLVTNTNRVMRAASNTYQLADELVQSHNYSRSASQNRPISATDTDTDVSQSYKTELSCGSYLLKLINRH